MSTASAERVRAAFRGQAQSCEALGSAFTARLLRLAANRLTPDTAPGRRLFGWEGDIGPAGQSVPLRLAGALHGFVLGGHAPALAACYPPNMASDDRLWAAVADTMHRAPEMLDRWLDSPPQTNEVRRAAVLIAAGHWLTRRFGMPLELSEVGASAGLNLMWDRFALDLPGGATLGPSDPVLALAPEWRGVLPPACPPRVTGRRGVDLNPLDPAHPDRIMAYIWPDQPERMARTRAALGVAVAPVDRADALDWLPRRLSQPMPGRVHFLFHTVAWQYLSASAKARGDAIVARAGAMASAAAPLARLGMEADDTGAPGAGLTLTLWPGGDRIDAGRVDIHGRWVDWRLA